MIESFLLSVFAILAFTTKDPQLELLNKIDVKIDKLANDIPHSLQKILTKLEKLDK